MTEQEKNMINRLKNSSDAQTIKNAKLPKTSNSAIAKFEATRNREIALMQQIVHGKTPINILKTTSERDGVTEVNLTSDGKVDTSKAVEGQRMTAELFIDLIMTMRNLSGQNVMISEDDVEKMGLKLAPHARPFYDKDDKKFYELSVTRRPSDAKNKRLNFYANNKVSQAVVDKFNAPATNPKDGVDPSVKSALNICDKLGVILGVTLQPNDKVDSFMPSTLGKASKKAKDTLSTLTFNKWQSKKFVPQSGKLYMNTKGMNGTEILTSYISNCAMRSFNTNIGTFLDVVKADRGFQLESAKDKDTKIEDYKKNYELIKYKLHNICTDLIASEMCKLIPDTTAEERLAMSEAYLVSAMQRMNELGKYLDDPYVMKFISTTVTNSVGRYNSNFAFSTKQIVEANNNVCGYKHMFKVGNRETAIFGEYDVPSNGDFQFTTRPTLEKQSAKTVAPDAKVGKETAEFPKDTDKAVSEIKNHRTVENSPNQDVAKNTILVTNSDRETVAFYRNDSLSINTEPHLIMSDTVKEMRDEMSHAGQDVFDRYKADFGFDTPTERVVEYVKNQGYKDGTAVEVSYKYKMIIDSNEKDGVRFEKYVNGHEKKQAKLSDFSALDEQEPTTPARTAMQQFVYDALSPEGKDVCDKFPVDFWASSPSKEIKDYIKSRNYRDGTNVEATLDNMMVIDSTEQGGFKLETYDNGYVKHLEAEKEADLEEGSKIYEETKKVVTAPTIDKTPSGSSNREGIDIVNGKTNDDVRNALFSNVPKSGVKIIPTTMAIRNDDGTSRELSEEETLIWSALSPEGKRIFSKFPDEFMAKENPTKIIEYINNEGYDKGDRIEINKFLIAVIGDDRKIVDFEPYTNGYTKHLKERKAELEDDLGIISDERLAESLQAFNAMVDKETNQIKNATKNAHVVSDEEIADSLHAFNAMVDKEINSTNNAEKNAHLVSDEEIADSFRFFNEQVEKETNSAPKAEKVAETSKSSGINANGFMLFDDGSFRKLTKEEKYVYEDLSPEGKELFKKFPDEFMGKENPKEIYQYINSKGYNEGDKIELNKYYVVTVGMNGLVTDIEAYRNGYQKYLDERAIAEENEARLARENARNARNARKVADAMNYYNNFADELTSDTNTVTAELTDEPVVASEKTRQTATSNESASNKLIDRLPEGHPKGVVKNNNYRAKPCKDKDPVINGTIKSFGERTDESIEKSITKYVVGLTSKALNEKSIVNKKRAVEKENGNPASAERAQAVSASQNAVTMLYNSTHTSKTAKQASEIIEKAEKSGDNIEIIEAKTLSEIESLNKKEIDKILTAYRENKDKHPEWNECKTPASFVNYYYKNIVGAETKYGVDLKRNVKSVCRSMDASVAVENTLKRDNITYRMYDEKTFIIRDEKSDMVGLNAYTVRKIVEKQNEEPVLETVTVYSNNQDLVENASYDEQFRDAFSSVEKMRENDGYIGKADANRTKAIIYPSKAGELHKAMLSAKVKNNLESKQ